MAHANPYTPVQVETLEQAQNELVKLADVVNQIIGNQKLVQRDDGRLMDCVVVPHTLSDEVVHMIGHFELVGAYAARPYQKGQVVTYNDRMYVCALPHQGGAVMDMGAWRLIGKAVQQLNDTKLLWMAQNGAALPYDATIKYAEGAVVVKDGELQKKQGASWVLVANKGYNLDYFVTGKSYPLYAEIMLDSGVKVASTVPNNTKNPNIDMTGWKIVATSREQLGITNVDNTSDLSKPVSTLTQAAINAAVQDKATIESVTRKADKTYVDQLVINANNGITNYQTQVGLLAFTPAQANYTAKALDTKKVWLWDGVKWNDTGLSELDLAKQYTDSYLKNVNTIASGTDIKTIVNVGTYLLLSSNSYTGLPHNLDQSELIILRVLSGTGAYVYQEIHKLNEPYRVWKKVLHVSSGSGSWTEPFYEYQKLLNAVDPVTVLESGYYVLTNGVGLPLGFSGTAMLQVEKFGGYTIRHVMPTGNSRQMWHKINNGIWVESLPFNIVADRLASNFAYRGLKTDANVNTLLDDGRYLINGAFTNAPSWIQDTIYLDVKVYGAFIIQTATSTATIDKIAQRRGMFSGGVATFGDWQKIGGGGGSGSGSSLSGKTIAFIGDSIVESGDYPERIGSSYSATIYKFGFGGCRASNYSTNPLGYDKQCLYNIAKCINTGDYSSLISGAEYTRDNHGDNNVPQATAMSVLNWNAVDILCIAFGTNDWTSENGLGVDLTPSSTGATYKGSMCYAIEQIQTKYPHLQIVLLGMSFRLRALNGVQDPNVHSDNTANSSNEYLKDYQKAILDIAEKYHLPALDMYKNSGLNSMSYSNYLKDGVHPKDVSGYQHWANKIGNFLNTAT